MELIKTELGLLPADWDVCKLLDCSELLNGLTYTPDNIKKNGLLVLRSSNIQNSRLVFDDNVYVDCDVDKNKYLKKDDILICVRNGSANLIGKNAIASKDLNATFGAFMAVLRGNDNKFIYQLFQKGDIQKRIKKNSSATINQITKADFESVLIQFPCYEERKAISSVLSNIDNLIDNLQELIIKKNKIFDSAKNDLLIGKHRHTVWKKVKVGDIGIFDGNGVDKKINKDERKVRLLNYMDIMHNNFIYDNMSNHFVTASDNKYNKCLVKAGDIFLTPSSETREDIGVSAVALEDSNDLVFSYHIVRFRPTIEMDMKYRAYIFQNKKFLEQASKYCEGSGKRYVCSNKKFASFELEIPFDVDEQAEIGKILYDMESEIKSLEHKLDKYKEIKNGMLEDLLTGKVRLRYE